MIQSIVSGVPIGSSLANLTTSEFGHADAAVGRMSGDQPRLVGAVDADDSAAGPIGLDVRQRRGAERHRPVDAADREPAEPIADVELPVRGGRARLAGAHVRKEDDLAVAIQGERRLLGRNDEVGMDRLRRDPSVHWGTQPICPAGRSGRRTWTHQRPWTSTRCCSNSNSLVPSCVVSPRYPSTRECRDGAAYAFGAVLEVGPRRGEPGMRERSGA